MVALTKIKPAQMFLKDVPARFVHHSDPGGRTLTTIQTVTHDDVCFVLYRVFMMVLTP